MVFDRIATANTADLMEVYILREPAENYPFGAIRWVFDMNVERRRHPRFKVRVPVELRMEGSNASIHTETTDLSLSGCYVAMPFPLAVGTTVEITLRLEGIRVAAVGLVATCDRGLGNGIGFERMLLEDHEKLMHYLDAVKEAQPSPESTQN